MFQSMTDRRESPTRILFFMAHLHKGGMQRAVSNITKSLSSSLELHVAYFGTENPAYCFQAAVHYLAVPPYRGSNPLKKLTNFLRRLSRLRNLIDRQRIDTVISFGEIGNVYNLVTPHRANKLISVRVDIPSQLKEFGVSKPLIEWLIYKLYSRAKGIVCVSKALEEHMRRQIRNAVLKTTTINNLYPIDEITALSTHELPQRYRFLEARTYIAAVGSLIRQKGFDVLIRAFAELKDHSVMLVIVGSGPDLDSLRQQVDSLDLSNRVVFIPHDANPYRYMARATIFALPSRYEGFPNVLVEAMASGAPVVAFDCPTGPREIIGNNEWGRLVSHGSEKDFRFALEDLLCNGKERVALCMAARKRALDFRASKIASQWEELFLSLDDAKPCIDSP
jgi:glycosyltransferase involved in cell wall biosynthesis